MSEASKVGSWADIGYEAPGVVSTGKSSARTNVISYAASGANGATWTATPINALNDCTSTSNWSLTATAHATGLEIADNSTGTTCKALTANWMSLTRSTAAAN